MPSARALRHTIRWSPPQAINTAAFFAADAPSRAGASSSSPRGECYAIVRFCLALAASRFGLDVHAAASLSSHYHLVVTDFEGRLPDFMHLFNTLVARAGNALLGRGENFWSSPACAEGVAGSVVSGGAGGRVTPSDTLDLRW